MALASPVVLLALGPHTFDVTSRAVVLGILNRTPDSFFDQGNYFGFDAFLRKAAESVADGADALDVGGVKAGPGDEVSEAEELDRVVPAVEALVARFDVPISVDTWRASVFAEAAKAGACVANDISGFADPDYLGVASAAGASVVATHIRLAPRVADPEPVYPDGLVPTVLAFLADRAQRAVDAGIPPERVMVDAGLDLGKSEPQSLELLRASDQLVALGYPVLLSASNKRFLGAVLDLEVGERRLASVAAHALGIILGCRILRVHDVRGTCAAPPTSWPRSWRHGAATRPAPVRMPLALVDAERHVLAGALQRLRHHLRLRQRRGDVLRAVDQKHRRPVARGIGGGRGGLQPGGVLDRIADRALGVAVARLVPLGRMLPPHQGAQVRDPREAGDALVELGRLRRRRRARRSRRSWRRRCRCAWDRRGRRRSGRGRRR